MIFKADEAQKYYNLLRKILKDLRESTIFAQDIDEKYEKIHNNIKEIHIDYVSFFCEFLEDIKEKNNKNNIQSAKRRFFSARRRQSKFRLLSKIDAHAYLANVTDISILRFLTVAIWYLSYSATHNSSRLHTLEALDSEILLALSDERIGEGAWDSSSDAFWDEIETSEDIEHLVSTTKRMLQLITERYALLEHTFLELPKGGVLSTPSITPTRYSTLLLLTAEKRKFGYALTKT